MNYNNSAGMDGSGYAAMMGDAFNVYNEGYMFDGADLGEIVVGYGRPARGLLRAKSVNSAVADFVSVEEETVADEAIPFQLATPEVSVRQDFATTLAFEPFLIQIVHLLSLHILLNCCSLVFLIWILVQSL